MQSTPLSQPPGGVLGFKGRGGKLVFYMYKYAQCIRAPTGRFESPPSHPLLPCAFFQHHDPPPPPTPCTPPTAPHKPETMGHTLSQQLPVCMEPFTRAEPVEKPKGQSPTGAELPNMTWGGEGGEGGGGWAVQGV